MPPPPAALPQSPPTGESTRLTAALRGYCFAWRHWSIAAAAVAVVLAGTPSWAITIQFVYPDDNENDPLTKSFFGSAANPTPARLALEFAAKTFTPFADSLAAIQPGGANSWTAQYLDPATNTLVQKPNLVVPQDTLIVYPIARNLADANIGQASIGFQNIAESASSDFRTIASTRGQGDQAFDFARWGGVLAIDTQNSAGQPRKWHYDPNSSPAPDHYDFYTTVTHELAHLFGFGLAPSFKSKLTTGDAANPVFDGSNAQAFTGAVVQSLAGGTVKVTSNGQHWSSEVTSPPFTSPQQPKPSLGPVLSLGTRKLFTPLDYAALADTGWQVPQELLGLPGDFNGDALVDGADFLTWQRGFGNVGVPGDANGDQVVDSFDGWIVRNYFGSRGTAFDGTSLAVPEPAAAAIALLASAVLGSAVRNRRR